MSSARKPPAGMGGRFFTARLNVGEYQMTDAPAGSDNGTQKVPAPMHAQPA
jgi:hypothetical protein